MKLTAAQHEQFDRNGYLFFPGLFSSEETRTLTDAVPGLYSRRKDYNVREKGKDAVRTERAINVAISLDDVSEYNGPPMFICGSHKRRVIDAKHDLTTTRKPGQRLPEPVRGQQPHPPPQAPGVHRAPRLHADRMPARRLPAETLLGRAALERRRAGQRIADLERRTEARGVRHLVSTYLRFSRGLRVLQVVFTAKDAKIAKDAREEQVVRSFYSFALLASLASSAVKILRTPPVLLKAHP